MSANYLSYETLTWLLLDVFKLGDVLKAPRYADHDEASVTQFLDTIKKLADSELYPVFREMDEKPAYFKDGVVKVHPIVGKIMRQAGELGLLGSIFSYDDGGIQLPHVVDQAAQYIIDSANNNLTGYTGLTTGAAGLLLEFGTAELKERFVPKMLSGEWAGTMCLTEPQAGSSLSDVATTATPFEDGSYSIKGQKIWISGGDHEFCENFIHLALVRVPGGGAGTKGISLMAIPKLRSEGDKLVPNDVTCVGDFQKMGQRGYATTHLVFGEKDQCRGWLVGTLHKGLAQMFQMMNGARISVGRYAAAISAAAYQASLQFARERPQGRRLQSGGQKNVAQDQTLIINHPDVRRMLFTQKAISEGALALVLQASVYHDLEATTEGDERIKWNTLLELLTPMAKTYPSEQGKRAVDLGLQVLGGAGFCNEYVLQQYYRDVRIMSIYEGTTGIQSIDLMGRKIQGQAIPLLEAEIEPTLVAATSEQLAPFAELLANQLKLNQQVLQKLAPLLAKGEAERYLADATVYMEFLGNIVVAWLWLKMAVAAEQHQPPSEFYQAKIHAMRFFFKYELARNSSLANILTNPDTLTIPEKAELFD
jgi:alkylation response protein AidB-like acyl-CoA dehydrogenase